MLLQVSAKRLQTFSHHKVRRLKHESHSHWKERILSIDSTANFIKEDNTIALATSFEKASRKAKRHQAKEGTKKKGSKNRNSLTYNILNRQATERQSQEAAMAISLQDRLAAYQNRQGTDEVVTDDDEKDDKDSCCCIPQSCVTRATILIKLHQQVDQKKIDTSTTTKISTQTGSLLRKNSKGKEAAVSMSLSERLAAYQKQGGGVCEDDHTISTSSSMSYEPSSQESSGSDIKERMAKLQRCNSSINNDLMSKQRKHDDPKEAAASSMSLKDRLEAYQNHQVNIDEEKKTTQQTILQHETSPGSSAQQQQTKIESTTNNILLQSRIKEVDAATSVSLKERMLAYKNGVALDNENEDDDELHKNEDQSSQNNKNVTSEEEEEEAKREVDLWFQRKQDKRSASYRAAAIAMKEEMNTEQQLLYVVSEEQQLVFAVSVPTRKKKKKNMLLTFIHRLFRRGNKKKGM